MLISLLGQLLGGETIDFGSIVPVGVIPEVKVGAPHYMLEHFLADSTASALSLHACSKLCFNVVYSWPGWHRLVPPSSSCSQPVFAAWTAVGFSSRLQSLFPQYKSLMTLSTPIHPAPRIVFGK